jgi:hypothetical protein
MAYLDTSQVFSQRNAFSVEMPEDFASTLPETDSFQPVEWAVIALAQHDSLATLRATRRSKLGRLLFGQPRRYNLTDERLEALRWLAVEAWHQPLAISSPALGGFIAAGFTNAQLALLLRTTGALRAIAGQTPLARAAASNPA